VIRVMTVDDHPLLREGIATLIGNQTDIELVAEASNGREALEQFRKYLPGDVQVSRAFRTTGDHSRGPRRPEAPAAGTGCRSGGARHRFRADPALSLSEETVKSHIRSILAKLGANDRTHAVTIGAKRGIIDL
jgi:DNA-binding NarL/FixJ family response regulator